MFWKMFDQTLGNVQYVILVEWINTDAVASYRLSNDLQCSGSQLNGLVVGHPLKFAQGQNAVQDNVGSKSSGIEWLSDGFG
jgi:hypothetical protein